MKKNYESPKAEKMEFDYAEAVVASGPAGCTFYITKSDFNYYGCVEKDIKQWIGDVITG